MSETKNFNNALETNPISGKTAGPDFLSMHQASKMTGYHQDYLGQMARSGKLEAHKVGRNWFTTKLAIDKMLGRVPVETVVETVVENVVENVISKVEEQPVVVTAQVPEMTAPPVVGNIAVSVMRAPVAVEPEPVLLVAAKETIKKTVRVTVFNTHFEAGPNMQELLSERVEEKVLQPAIVDLETKNLYHRWKKLRVVTGIKNSRLESLQETFSSKVEATTKPFWTYASSALAVVAIALLGTIFYTTNFSQEETPQNIVGNLEDEKRVAGEASDSAEEPLWPPDFSELESSRE